MAEKIEYKIKNVVSTRQLYRRVAASIKDMWEEIHQIQDTGQEIQINSKEKCEHNTSSKNNVNSTTIANAIIDNNADVNVDHNNTNVNIEFNGNSDDLNNVSEVYDYPYQSVTNKDNELFNNFEQRLLIETIPQDNKKENLSFQLKYWATVQHNISQAAINDLLKILSPFHSELPLNSRTLLKTELFMPTRQLDNGQLCYMGLLQLLKQFISRCPSLQLQTNEINISFNIDGLPLFKSSNIQLWPILGLIKNCPKENPFVIAIYCGNCKPSPLDIFLEDFVNELFQLLHEGFLFENKLYTVKVHSFICDAPARAYVKCTKSHNGYSSCDKCIESGEYFERRIIFRSILAPRRTDLDFQLFTDEDHHTNISPLSKLPLGLVTKFPIDYMHAVCLGVMKKLLNLWVGGNLRIRLPGRLINLLSERLISFSKFIPVEFNRKPRSLSELSRWKATELRMFLLYLGPVALKNILPTALYENFLLFHCSIIILCCKKHINTFGTQLPEELLTMFIRHCENIYGSEFLIYNVHILCHLSNDVKKYGPLDNFSAFPFENYLRTLKNLVRSPHKPLQQIFRRLKEIDVSNNIIYHEVPNTPLLSLDYSSGPLPDNGIFTYKMFRKVIYNNFTFYVWQYRPADCYCYVKGKKILQLHNILLRCHDNTVLLYGKEFLNYYSYYIYPYNSDISDIFLVKNLSETFVTISFQDIIAKCIVIPDENNFQVSFPLIHQIE